MDKLKKILIAIGTIIISFFAGILSISLLRDDSEKIQENAEKIKEEKKHELEKKSAADIAHDSPNHDTISTNIEKEQQELRKRLRDRLKQNVHGNGSSGNN